MSIVGEVADIAEAMSVPVDTEWVYDGTDVWWVQVRGIGGLDEVTVYSRRIAKEVLPGLIKPLVWSINVPMVNKAWLDLLEAAVGELGLEPEELAHPFGYRAYFNMTAIGGVFEALGMPRESLELLLGLPSGSKQPSFKPGPGTIRKLPRMAVLGGRIARYGRTVDRELPILDSLYRYLRRQGPRDSSHRSADRGHRAATTRRGGCRPNERHHPSPRQCLRVDVPIAAGCSWHRRFRGRRRRRWWCSVRPESVSR